MFPQAGIRTKTLRLTLAVVFLTIAGCRHRASEDAGITIHESISPTPLRVGSAVATFQILTHDGVPLQGAKLEVEADMSHPGMAPIFSTATELSPGKYQAVLSLTMAGDWVLLLHLHCLDGKQIERQLDLRNVQPK